MRLAVVINNNAFYSLDFLARKIDKARTMAGELARSSAIITDDDYDVHDERDALSWSASSTCASRPTGVSS